MKANACYLRLMVPLLLIFAGLAASAYGQCSSDGCSAKLSALGNAGWANNLSEPTLLFYNEVFAPACRHHDYCYRSGYKTYGYTKDQCDRWFRERMLGNCGDWALFFVVATGGAGVIGCTAAAGTYYEAVTQFGGSSFHGADGTCCLFTPAATPATACAAGSSPPAPPPQSDITGALMVLE
jgi:hypothetical protein